MSARVRRTAGRAASAGVIGSVVAGLVLTASPASAGTLGYTPDAKGSLTSIARVVGADQSYRAGITGAGIGVALIDTGVTPVPGLDTGNVVDGPDLSFDSQDPELAHLDAYGHGTHLASIIAGRDAKGSPASYADPARFAGIAPDATLVDVKVGASDGAVDVTQVIAGINWVVEHRNDPGLNIRVINLSYGTNATQDTAVDPLAFAVENAWRNGIVVVVAGGNDGSTTYNLANPARDPYVLAVGASDSQGTIDVADDIVPSWGTRGTNQRHVDVVAPGVSVLGLRVPNGYADERNPSARVGDRFAKASGTSQAAAVVSGEVALMLQANPSLAPDQVKRQLMNTARSFPSASVQYRGSGTTQVRQAQLKPGAAGSQPATFFGNGTGSIEAARGTSHVSNGTTPLKGEVDVFGQAWDGAAWAQATTGGTVWSGGHWRGELLTGDGWAEGVWPATEWTASTWAATTWRDAEWTARTWRNGAWVASTWSASTWSASTWSARTWRDATWSARTWRAADYASAAWG